MAKTLKINNVDYTSLCPPAGYQVSTKHVYGGNKMTMSNGAEFQDEIAIMSTITVPFIPLTDAQVSNLAQTLYTNQTCDVYFFDPDLNEYRTITANRKMDKRKYRGAGADGNDYWTGVVCTFEER